MARYTICQQLVSILHLLPTHVNEFAAFPDWVDMFLWLLTPFSPSGGEEKASAEAQGGGGEEEKSCYSSLVVREKEASVPVVEVEMVGSMEQRREEAAGAGVGGGVEEEMEPKPRNRLSAFVHSPLPTPALEDTPPRRSLAREKKTDVSTQTEDKNQDVSQTFHIVTETVGYILWHSVDYERQRPPWKVWGSVFSSIDSFTSSHPLLLPAFLVKQRCQIPQHFIVYVNF